MPVSLALCHSALLVIWKINLTPPSKRYLISSVSLYHPIRLPPSTRNRYTKFRDIYTQTPYTLNLEQKRNTLVPLITLCTLKAIIFAQYGSHGIGLLYTSIYWAIFLVIWLIAVTRIFRNYRWYSHFFTILFGVLLGIKIILHSDTAELVMALAILIISLGLIVGFTSRKIFN